MATTSVQMASSSVTPEEIISALKSRQLHDKYQPIWNIRESTPTIISAEQLARWDSISPDIFLAVAKQHTVDTGFTLMDKITLELMQQGCHSLVKFNKKKKEGSTTSNLQYITVNLGADQFLNSVFMSKVESLIPPHLRNQITLELLENWGEDVESRLESSLTPLTDALNHAKSLGFKLSLDDVGTDNHNIDMIMDPKYAELLSMFDYLKIDASLVCPGGYGSGTLPNVEVISQIIERMKSLHGGKCCKIICEGVETAEQLKVLEKIECITYVQGWFFGRATSFDEVTL